METILLVIHVIIATALIGMVLVQRSDSDGFGLGGGGGGSGFMSSRGTATFLTRTTAVLATLFILNSLALGIIAANRSSNSIVDTINEQQSDSKLLPVAKDAEKKDNKTTSKKDAAPSVPTAE